MEFHFRNQISLIEDREEKEWMKTLDDKKKFLFTNNGIADMYPTPGHNISKF